MSMPEFFAICFVVYLTNKVLDLTGVMVKTMAHNLTQDQERAKRARKARLEQISARPVASIRETEVK